MGYPSAPQAGSPSSHPRAVPSSIRIAALERPVGTGLETARLYVGENGPRISDTGSLCRARGNRQADKVEDDTTLTTRKPALCGEYRATPPGSLVVTAGVHRGRLQGQ